ncbi:hypothetical protein [Prosthecobacter sp.]|uniref:hypothetical protein n=1 Tax=Prosthecobacter sp. TaxID=1965333 RepID=UPI0037849425
MQRTLKIFSILLIAVLLPIMVWDWVKTCTFTEGKGVADSKSKSTITVGVYPNHDIAGGEIVLEGYESFEYYFDGVFLGAGDQGVEHLLAKLNQMKPYLAIDVLNPATFWIGEAGHPPGLRDIHYKYPLVKNIRLRSEIKSTLDRIRGWSDDTKPDLPWKE